MAFDKHAVKFGGIDNIFDESGNRFSALRKIAWVPNRDDIKLEDYEEKAKFEIRNWMVNDAGEVPLKGYTFMSDEGPNELTKALVHEGFGNTKDILKELRTRDDFKESVETINDSEADSTDGEYFDMRSLLDDDNSDDEEEAS